MDAAIAELNRIADALEAQNRRLDLLVDHLFVISEAVEHAAQSLPSDEEL